MSYLPTGIETLDRLLGGKGFRHGTTIVIRGAAGTGKTTLAFQIAVNSLRLEHENYSVVFAGLEENPDLALGRIFESLEFQHQVPQPSPSPDLPRFSSTNLGGGWKEFLRRYPIPRFIPIGLSDFWDSDFDGKLNDLLIRFWTHLLVRAENQVLLVVDSLDALVSGMVALHDRYTERQIIVSVLRSFELWWGTLENRPTVIFTAEDVPGSPTSLAESYLADVVIELRSETVALRFPVAERGPWTEKRQTHLFCRVTKARGLPNQRRGSCYALVARFGLKFFPTYAAEGLVSLFAENAAQLAHISSIRSLDIPSYYPGVDIQEFERTGLQRIFAVQRHIERIPPRRPLFLSNIDEYWVDVLGRKGQLQSIDPMLLYPGSIQGGEPIGELLNKHQGPNRTPFFRNDDGKYLAVPYLGNVGMLVYRKDVLAEIGVDKPPETWEELGEICIRLKLSTKTRSDGSRLPYKFLIETQTYDTLMTTALEFWWSNGVYWTTYEDGEGRMAYDLGGFDVDEFVKPIEQLACFIHNDKITPLSASMDPGHPSGLNPATKRADWVFARHWYSTWVDVRTKRDKGGALLANFDEGAEFGIAPLPVFRRRLNEFQGREGECPHHSGWGEWYLAIQKGSENVEMGIDLINNLITARKLNELAFSGAGLPLWEQSYVIHGHAVCPWIDVTFNDLKTRFFQPARSRIEFFNYRKVGRVFYGALNAILTNPSLASGDPHRPDISSVLQNSLRELGPRLDRRGP